MQSTDIKIEAMQSELAAAEEEFYNLKKQQKEVRKRYSQLKAKAKTLGYRASGWGGATCDGNYCSDSKPHEALQQGQIVSLIHDDQDTSDFNVVCESGKIEVIISVAPWETWHELKRKVLSPGENWAGTIDQYDEGYDQTIKLEIVAIENSFASFSLESWDT